MMPHLRSRIPRPVRAHAAWARHSLDGWRHRLAEEWRDLRWELAGRPAILHITHYKAGSQWVAEVLKHVVDPGRWVVPESYSRHLKPENLRRDAVLPTIYLPRPQVEAVVAQGSVPTLRFVVIRDLRDTLVSLYFSLRYSHVVMDNVASRRAALTQMSLDEGLLWLLTQRDDPRDADPGLSEAQHEQGLSIVVSAQVQRTWFGAKNCLLIRYEDLVADEQATFRRIVDYCQIRVDPQRLYYVVANNSFAARTGRKPGQEDIMAHQRKGIVGDWHNYFGDQLKAEFKARYGDLLILTGYEQNLDW